MRIVPTTVATRSASPAHGDLPVTAAPAWRVALVTIVVMMRNVVLSALVAFLAAFLTSRGNIFRAVSPSKQSRTEYLASTMLWIHWLGFVGMMLVLSLRLTSSGCKPFRHWFVRLIPILVVPYGLTVAAYIAIVWFCDRIVPPRLDFLHIEFYLESLGSQVFFAVCDARARFLYRTETVAGQRRPSTTVSNHNTKRSTYRLVFRAFIAGLQTQVASLIASLYVQIASQWRFDSTREINLFVGGSLVFKLAMQEAAKHALLSRGVTNLRIMALVVSVPTVIIDTQVRVVILSVAHLQSSVTSSYILAVAEIVLRTAKVVLLRRSIERKRRRIVDEMNASLTAFATWRQNHLRFHTAETHADMYAEYIAILCSAAIAVFWSGNPHYNIGAHNDATASLWKSLAWQAGLEVLVDYVSSVIEIRLGATVDTRSRGFGAFLGVVFAMLVIINMNISAVLYIRSR